MQLEWNLIADYSDERINTGTACFKKSFELYVSRKGQIAWSPYKDGEPHINPQRGVFTGNLTETDIGRLLNEMARIELKTRAVKAEIMVTENQDLVRRVLVDFRAYKIKG